jgi:hypothetical protein
VQEAVGILLSVEEEVEVVVAGNLSMVAEVFP